LFDDSSGHAESDIGTLHFACIGNFAFQFERQSSFSQEKSAPKKTVKFSAFLN